MNPRPRVAHGQLEHCALSPGLTTRPAGKADCWVQTGSRWPVLRGVCPDLLPVPPLAGGPDSESRESVPQNVDPMSRVMGSCARGASGSLGEGGSCLLERSWMESPSPSYSHHPPLGRTGPGAASRGRQVPTQGPTVPPGDTFPGRSRPASTSALPAGAAGTPRRAPLADRKGHGGEVGSPPAPAAGLRASGEEQVS